MLEQIEKLRALSIPARRSQREVQAKPFVQRAISGAPAPAGNAVVYIVVPTVLNPNVLLHQSWPFRRGKKPGRGSSLLVIFASIGRNTGYVVIERSTTRIPHAGGEQLAGGETHSHGGRWAATVAYEKKGNEADAHETNPIKKPRATCPEDL